MIIILIAYCSSHIPPPTYTHLHATIIITDHSVTFWGPCKLYNKNLTRFYIASSDSLPHHSWGQLLFLLLLIRTQQKTWASSENFFHCKTTLNRLIWLSNISAAKIFIHCLSQQLGDWLVSWPRLGGSLLSHHTIIIIPLVAMNFLLLILLPLHDSLSVLLVVVVVSESLINPIIHPPLTVRAAIVINLGSIFWLQFNNEDKNNDSPKSLPPIAKMAC